MKSRKITITGSHNTNHLYLLEISIGWKISMISHPDELHWYWMLLFYFCFNVKDRTVYNLTVFEYELSLFLMINSSGWIIVDIFQLMDVSSKYKWSDNIYINPIIINNKNYGWFRYFFLPSRLLFFLIFSLHKKVIKNYMSINGYCGTVFIMMFSRYHSVYWKEIKSSFIDAYHNINLSLQSNR